MQKLFFSSLLTIIFLFIISGLTFAQTPVAGLQPGANVKIIKKDGNIFEGKLLRATETEYQINTMQKMTVKKFLKDIKKITDTGKSDLGGGISYRPVHDYLTVNGQSFQGIYFGGLGMSFDIDLVTYGIQKNISIESLKSIEVIADGGGVSEQECTLVCPHCGKPIRIKISK
jgi:hypothetical protein